MPSRGATLRLWAVLALLVVMQFYIRPRLWDSRAAPDFLLLALILFAIRSRPGHAAIAGFITGIAADAMTPARFGAGALAHTMVGYLAAWGRAVFFADNLVVNAGLIFGGTWLRNAIVLIASGTGGEHLLSGLTFWSPLQAAATALAGVIVLVVFRSWLDIRLET
ncbi:MAG: rod shape-determining protein MreD [Gemmatimonadota bacterium]